MSFWDDVLQYGPAILGGAGGAVAGSFAGNPFGGAMIGASLGGSIGNMLENHSGDDAMNKYQGLLGQLPTYQGPQPGQGLTAADRAAFDQAKTEATNVARSHEQGLEAADLARSGGASQSGKLLSAQMQSGQAAMGNLHGADMQIAAEAANRDRANRMMLNDFNQRNMMMRAGITGSMADLSERQDNANTQNRASFFNSLGNAGMQIGKYFNNSKLYKDGVPNSPQNMNNGGGLSGAEENSMGPDPKNSTDDSSVSQAGNPYDDYLGSMFSQNKRVA